MVTRREALQILGSAVTGLVVGGVIGYYGGISSAPKPTKITKPIPIGAISPLSPPGDYAAGAYLRRGEMLAQTYVNKVMNGVLGRPINVIIEDSSGIPEKGVAAARMLISEEDVVGIAGLYHSSVALAVQDLCEQMHIPVIIVQASAAKITEKHYRYTFRIHAIDPARDDVVLNFAKKNGWKKIAVIAEDTDYGVGIAEDCKKRINNIIPDGKILVIVFPRTTTDLTPQLLKIKNWGPDVVYNVGVGAPANLIIKQAYDIGLFPSVPMIGSYDFPTHSDFWPSVGKKGIGIYFIAYLHPKMKMTDLGKWVAGKYKELYNEDITYTAANEFGNVLVLVQAMQQAGSDDPDAITDALRKGKFKTWNSDNVTFPEKEGVYWHQFVIPMLVLQYTEYNQSLKDAKIVYSK